MITARFYILDISVFFIREAGIAHAMPTSNEWKIWKSSV